MTRIRTAAACALLALTGSAAFAGEVYGAIGLPGVMGGYAQPLGDSFTVRADFATLGSRSRTTNEEGIDYNVKLKANRFAVFGDWYPFSGTFRLTGGVTANDYKLTLAATGAGGSLTIGDNTYTTTAADRVDGSVKFPGATPYLGIGWGHQNGSGLRFSADIGAMFGKAKLTYSISGPLAAQVSQADLDKETQQLRDGVAKVRWIPQISFGIGYSF